MFARTLTASHVLGAIAVFVAVGLDAASRSQLGRLLPAGESPGFVWLREHAVMFVGLALAWLFTLNLVRRPRASRAGGVQVGLAAIEVAAIVAVAAAVVRPWSELLSVAHTVLQASILLQVLASGGADEPTALCFLDLPARHHVAFLGAAFVFAAAPLLGDPGIRRLPAFVVLDSDVERALARALPALLSGITGLWAAVGLLALLAALRAVSARLSGVARLHPALDRLPFVLVCGAGAAAFVATLAPAIAWELHALDLAGLMAPLVLLVALVGGILTHTVSRRLARVAPPSTPPTAVGLLALSVASLPVFPVVWWLTRRAGRASWQVILAVGFATSVGLAAGVLFGGLFNAWFTVFSYLKWFLLKTAAVIAAGIVTLAVDELRLPRGAAGGARHHARANGGIPIRWATLGLAVALPLTLVPFHALERFRETKAAVLQFSELAMVDARYARAVARALGLSGVRLGQAPGRTNGPDPWPAPWTLERIGPSRLPRDFNLVVIVVDALRGDAFRSAGYQRDLAPFLDRWARDEAISFRRAYSQGGGTFASFPFLIAGRSRLDLYGPGLHRENLYLKLAEAEGIRHVAAVHEFGPSALFPPDVRVIGPERPRPAGAPRSVPADEVLGWAREAIAGAGAAQRFFVYVHLLDVHNDLWKKTDGLDFGDAPRDLYDNNVSYVDRAMARFIDWLRARGLYERTVILFTSDHGEQFWEHGASLHGHTLYEEELRVPLILLTHGVRGYVEDVPAVVADAVPTLLDLAGYAVRPPHDDSRMGISLVPLLTGGARDRYLRRDVVGRASFKRTYFLYRDWRWKLTWSAEFDLVQLFDLAMDPGERHSLVQEQPELAAHLERDLLAYLARVEGRVYRPLLSR
ncbi:MAG: sulfatase-like hydrolase/transferase [Candidatus Rokuibacteriota bacterium]